MTATPRFLQGIYSYEGAGLEKPVLLHETVTYTVPAGVRAQPLYFRGGNSAGELVCIVLVRDGSPMRYFPIGAKSDVHVQLRIVEDLLADSRIELHLSAPEGVTGSVVVDLGLVEV